MFDEESERYMQTMMYRQYDKIAHSLSYIKHVELIREFSKEPDYFLPDWKIRSLEILKEIYLDDDAGKWMFISLEDKQERHFLISSVSEFIDNEINKLKAIEEDQSVNVRVPIKTKPIKPSTLVEIWNPTGKLEYEEMISFLKRNCLQIECAFVEEVDGKLTWAKIPAKGWQQYIAGFLHVCMKHALIPKDTSAPELTEIIKNTFNVRPDDKPFKSLYSNPPANKKYLAPFERFVVDYLKK